MQNVEKWSNILSKYCGVNSVRFLKYVWPFLSIMHERVNCQFHYVVYEAKLGLENDHSS